MNRLPPFTLVHVPSNGTPGGEDSGFDIGWTGAEGPEGIDPLPETTPPELRQRWKSLPPALQRTLVASARSVAPKAVESVLLPMLQDLDRQDTVKTVAIWDIDAQVGFLPDEVKKLNEAQSAFTFFVLQAAVPAGLVSTPARIAEWARKINPNINLDDLQSIQLNVIVDDVFPRALKLREDAGVEMLVGIVAKPLAFTDANGPHWNYFSFGVPDGVSLISTRDLRQFAQLANREFATAVAFVLIGQILATVSPLQFHEKSHGSPCLFDFNRRRESIVDNIKHPEIHPDCLAKIPIAYRSAAVALVKTLGS